MKHYPTQTNTYNLSICAQRQARSLRCAPNFLRTACLKISRYTARHVRLCAMATQTTDINVALA